jgi:hypothetical protein
VLYGTLVVAALLRLNAYGWGLFLFLIVYVAIWLGHVVVHELVIWRGRTTGPPNLRTVIASHLLFFLATLLQTDFTDASTIMVFTSLFGADAPRSWPFHDLRTNFLMYLPAVATGVTLFWQARMLISAMGTVLLTASGVFALYALPG